MSELLTEAIVRILDSNGNIAGTGFVVSTSGLIATCSHVVQHEALQERGIPRPEKVTVVFYATGDEQDALIEPKWWLPWDAGDLAILRIEGMLPQGIQPLLLGLAEGTSGHEVSTFGFPDVDAIEGLGGSGRVVRVLSRTGKSILQLQSSEITVGFSGAPIWDKLGRRVIGMVVAITEPDRHHRLEETAFAIATETLRNVCPVLQLSEVCPYRGLAAFTEADTDFFFGRQQTIDGLLNRLRLDLRFLMVLGPSGSGKSSVIQAGLIPQVRSGKVPGSDRWGIIVTRPATQPFDELTKQGVVDGTHDLTENVRIWLNQHTEQERLMLVIDQFEELLSICPEAIRQAFITQLGKLLHSPLPIIVVLVMRDDFYSRLTQQEALVEWLERSRGPLHVPRFLKKGELIVIVQKPIEAVGLRFEEGLVETVVKDTLESSSEDEEGGQVGRSAVLPLLEFALTDLWERRQQGMLTHKAYNSIGGVVGALPQWADRAFYTLKPGDRRLAQRILTSLVFIGDKSQSIFDSRRRRTLPSLCQNADEQESVERIVQHLVANRLLATDRDLQSNEETVEIIHDVLLRKWGLLQGWLEEDHRFLTWHQELERLVHVWSTQHDKTKLLRGRGLIEAKEWLRGHGADLNQEEVAFIRASVARRIQSLVGLILVVLLLVSSMGIASWYVFFQPKPTLVTTLQDDKVGSLRWCINNAPSGSTIRFVQDISGTIDLTGGGLTIESGKQLTIAGPGADQLTISGGNRNAIIHVSEGATLIISGLSFKHSETVIDAFLFNEGTLTLTNTIISDNKTTSGSTSFGGGIQNGRPGTLTVINSTISNNSAFGNRNGQGGGIDNEGKLTVVNTKFLDNTANGNQDGAGGGIANGSTGKLIVTNSIFSNNSASGTHDSEGGSINNEGKLTVVNSTFSHNTANGDSSFGGGINNHSAGTLMVTDSTFSDDMAIGKQSGQGGSINNGGKLIVVNSTFSHNMTSGMQTGVGGGIANSDTGTLTVTNSTFLYNTANGGSSFGGGIVNIGTLTVTSSTFLSNMVSGKQGGQGGGIDNGGKLMVVNTTFFNNTASSLGGGIISESSSYANLLFCTIYGNTSNVGGGIWVDPTGNSHMMLSRSIIVANIAAYDPDISGVLISGGYNLIANIVGAKGLNITTDRQVKLADLKIDPTLFNNGGPTQTLALLSGSPAIDAVPQQSCSITIADVSGQTVAITTDQRGDQRPDGTENACDIGAYESSY